MKPVFSFIVVLLLSLIVSCTVADTTHPPTPSSVQTPPSSSSAPAAPAQAAAAAPVSANVQTHTPPTTPSPPSPSASPSASQHQAPPATPPSPPVPQSSPPAAVPVAEHHHQKIEADLSHLSGVVSAHGEKLGQLSQELGNVKASASLAVSAAALDALKLDVKNSIDSLSTKAADHNAKLLADKADKNDIAQSLRSSEEKLAGKIEQLERKIQHFEKNAEEIKAQFQQIQTSFQSSLHAFQAEFNEKLAKVAESNSFEFTFDWNTIWATIVTKSKAAAAKSAELSVQLYERAQKEFATFRAESIPSREEAEKIVKEWWENAQHFYWNTAQPVAIDLYHTARHYFDDATEQLTDVLADKANVPKETARLIALSFLALTAGVLAFVVFVIVLQIVSFLLSIVFYFLCCRFCRSNKKNKKEKKVSASPAPAPATAASAQAAKTGTAAATPPVVKKDNKSSLVKNSPFHKTQA